MRTPELGLAYLVVGAIVALAFARRTTKLDTLLLFGFWPLYGPFLALAQAPEDPLASINKRIADAHARVKEIDLLLERPEFSEAQAIDRSRALAERGDLRAQKTAEARLESIHRLRSLRERFQRELDHVAELMAQLSVQAELVRLSGGSTEDLLAELIARADGLDELLREERAT